MNTVKFAAVSALHEVRAIANTSFRDFISVSRDNCRIIHFLQKYTFQSCCLINMGDATQLLRSSKVLAH